MPTHFTPKRTVTGVRWYLGCQPHLDVGNRWKARAADTDDLRRPPTAPRWCPAASVSTRDRPPTREDGTLGGNAPSLDSARRLHHRSHVHTFVGGNGEPAGSFTVEDRGDVRCVLL